MFAVWWRTSGFSCRSGAPRYANLNWPEPDRKELPSYRPIGAVAARLLARRWHLYVAACVAVIALEALFYTFVHVRFAQLYAMLIGQPLLIVVVTVYAGCDARGVMPSNEERWTRIVERAWAIIIVDVALSLVTGVGFETMQMGDARDVFMGTLVLFLAAMLVYAEPYICLADDVQALSLIPFAVLRSMMLAWVNMSRIFSLFALQLVLSIADVWLEQQSVKWFKTAAWTGIVYWAIVNVPVAVLFAVAYLDTLSQERKMVRP